MPSDIGLQLDEEQYFKLRQSFSTIGENNDGYIIIDELERALNICGLLLPGYEVRDLKDKCVLHDDKKLSVDEFANLYVGERAKREVGHQFRSHVTAHQGVEVEGGATYASSEGTTHHVKEGEEAAYTEWINRHLSNDPDCRHLMPLDVDGKDLYAKITDGILVCKLINHSVPNTIDERTVNKSNLNVYRRHENLLLAVTSASAIGCTTVNIGPEDLDAGRKHLVLGLLWQIIRIGLLSDINLYRHPGMLKLLREGETPEDLLRLSPDQLLLRWVNYHMEGAGCDRRVSNFSVDIKDSIVYTHLLHQIAPKDSGVSLSPLYVTDTRERAECMLTCADMIGCRSFVGSGDVVSGNSKLNLAFVANLFNNYPGFDQVDVDVDIEVIEESREEKTYRNWMNSLGVSPFVHYIYSDLTCGRIIFQLYDHIQPGLVDWSRVVVKFNKLKENFEKIVNCNYAIELGPKVEWTKVVVIGISGKDLNDGNKKLTLGLVWQLMRAYSLSVLAKCQNTDGQIQQQNGKPCPIQDKQILQWANSKLPTDLQFSGFNDAKLSDGTVIARLIDAIKPGIVSWANLVCNSTDQAAWLANARYVIGCARKIGAGVYALPEDIVEVKPKILLTVFACLMVRAVQAGNVMQGLTSSEHH